MEIWEELRAAASAEKRGMELIQDKQIRSLYEDWMMWVLGHSTSRLLGCRFELWRLPLFPSQELIKESIVGLEFMSDNEVLVAGTSSGELLAVSVSSQLVEVVGNLEGGLVQISASPDGELLAVITGLGMLLVMTTDWEVLYEISLHEHTQLKDVGTDNDVNPANELVDITWRSDGKYFATLDGSTRCGTAKELRIWERDTGALHSCTKALSMRSSGLDWIPNGSRLATAYCQDMSQQPARVAFFERNGLERGYFDVSGPADASIGCLRWNCNSELFAVLLNCRHFDAIQIWSFSNYHWYLKSEWQYTKESLIRFSWDPERPMHLFTWTTLGLVQPVTLCWDSAATGDSVALVVDGPRVLVTPLTQGIVPPPMSLFQLKYSSTVNTVCLHQTGEGGCLVASSLSSGAIGLLALPAVEKWDTLEGSESIIPDASFLEQAQKLPSLRLLRWLDSSRLLGVVSSASSEVPVKVDSCRPPWEQKDYSDAEFLLELEIFRGKEFVEEVDLCKSDWSFKCAKQTLLDRRVLAVADHPSEEGLLIHFEDGSFSLYTSKGSLIDHVGTPAKRLVYPSLWIQALLVPASQNVILLGLDVDGKLQVDSKVMTKDCTSFSVHRTCIDGRSVLHVLYTTKQDILFVENIEDILKIKDSSSIKQDSPTLPEKRNEERTVGHRKEGIKDVFKTCIVWERGARLVTALGGHSAAVILQTLRGNLETVYPRNLVAGSIMAALCESKFNEAMLLARRHHINLNLLVDFQGWKLFIQQCVDFVRQVKNLNHITELVCAVSAGNLADNSYQDLLLPFAKETPRDEPSEESQLPGQGSKIQSIMHAIRKALEDEVVASPRRELCILTTMARSDPPELEEALFCIKKLREEEMNQVIQEDDVDNSSKRLSAEEALKHLLWLSDSKLVFNAALGLYDLHLAAMVAANSQGDPKEFLPLLQDLEKMPTSLMKYKIDHSLQRYQKALENLAAAGSAHFDQCLDLIRDQPQLFPIGRKLFQTRPENVALLEAWGDYLLGKEKFEDAAAAFSSCSQLQKAMGAYRAGGMWQCVLVVAGMMEYTQEEVLKLAHELREELQALGRPRDAANIALEHCREPEDAVHLYIEAREWMEAVRVAYMCKSPKLIQEQVQSAALECATSYIAEFQESIEKVGKYLARYLAVKQRRVLLELKVKMGDLDAIEEDTVSDVSSHVSGMSVYTTGTRSSKLSLQSSVKGSKQGGGKSKGGRIRAGSPGEEAALVEHLKGMKVAERTLEEVKKLLHILVFFKQNVVAEKLQRLVFQFQSSQHKSVLEAEGNLADNISQSNWAIEVLGTTM
ncbi:hypothetical protein GOP47_0009260 [Adiantum capillus-veneris]|uniref:Elongator complex protein 1 n=1 Tax=Adiantum capillus-veneris TaxID=13818 RepID=A0A9D4UW96_ADICA|nr:hypothetical protein GOP47_0009260 [Adiantum capillus-veneris]